MKERMKLILDAFYGHNFPDMASRVFGFDSSIVYDALVIAPSYSPYHLQMERFFKVTMLRESAYRCGYYLENAEMKLAWVLSAASAGNLIDHLASCAALSFKKLIFIGAVGALKAEFRLGDICTPSYSLSGSQADAFLIRDSIRETALFEKVEPDKAFTDAVIALGKARGHDIRRAGVFCTPSIALEYLHLDEIRASGADLIEMETASFYLMAELLEIPAIALLVVSDNSASGVPLVGRTEQQQEYFNERKLTVFPDMIMAVAGMR